jgi:hypothetical protein
VEQNKIDNSLIMQIVERAKKIAARQGSKIDAISLTMDLDCVHKRTPLRLQDLRDADDFNFIHDVFGIQRHLDRKSGTLGNFFSPRFEDVAKRKGRPD